MESSKSINVHKYLLTKGRGVKKQDESAAKGHKQQAPRDVTNVVRSAINAAGSVTPAIVKRKQIIKQQHGFISSPTDSVLSPCSQKLWKREQPDMANVAKFNLANASMDDEEEMMVDAAADCDKVAAD